MKCPYCNSGNVSATNLGRRVAAGTAGVLTGFVVSLFSRRGFASAGMNVNRMLCKEAEYRCNCCGKTFKIGR